MTSDRKRSPKGADHSGAVAPPTPRDAFRRPRDEELEATVSVNEVLRPASRSVTDLPDTIGDYRIVRLLGEGGMGVVFEAEQRSPSRRVALKLMRRGHLVDEVHARMFHHEAETLGRLRHPNIAAIYESGHTPDGHDFFAMELVEGPTLDQWLQRREGPLTPNELEGRLRLFQTICAPVHYAHQRGVIHRDLKPTNLIVTEDASGGDLGASAPPSIKILDFGLARITDPDLQAATMMSEVGVIKGTLPYMSPEQAEGDVDAIDVRTDVYALGVILYELISGHRPYEVHQSPSGATARRQPSPTTLSAT